MGCATSKEAPWKRAARESWYAPVSRSISAPIHYLAETDEDSCHVVSLDSSSYGILEVEKPRELMNNGSFVRMLHERQAQVQGYAHDEKSSRDSAMPILHSSKLKPVKEEENSEKGDMEIINTWELMEGLDEDGNGTPCPVAAITTVKHRIFEKSVSFNLVHELDSCFTEISSPVWRKYYVNEAEEKEKAQKKLGFGHQSSMSFGGAEEQLGYAGFSDSRSPTRSPSKSVLGSSVQAPLRSPILESNSPLFDPSLMATFEQALQTTVPLPLDNWMLMHDNEESLTNSSASSGNHTWASSETSSDAESPPLETIVTSHEKLARSSREMSSKVSPWDVTITKPLKAPSTLQGFELRCPPRGEEKVVLYFTSLRGVRKTYEDCCELRLILQGLGIYVDERDVWMHGQFRDELIEILESKKVQVPRLFIKGRYIGGAEEVRQLHEDGALIRLIEDLPSLGLLRRVCDGCADVRFVPCLTCSGSCKVLDDNNEYVRCSMCNENGLMMCPLCS